jgi:hypothetical protein
MRNAERFNFTPYVNEFGETTLKPFLPVTLFHQGQDVSVSGLLDSGAEINVLPYRFGIELGEIWKPELATIRLGGRFNQIPACPLVVQTTVGKFAAVRLAFAWAENDQVPVILGQVNFFMEFDVCFYRARQAFELCPKV